MIQPYISWVLHKYLKGIMASLGPVSLVGADANKRVKYQGALGCMVAVWLGLRI